MKKFLMLLFVLIAIPAYAQQMVEATAESIIFNNDIEQARNEAILRAKWTAAENVLGVKVKAQSVVSNFALVDEVIQKSVSGYVESYKVLSEGRDGEVYRVKILAKVVRENAEKALSSIARVSSVAVLLPAFFLDGSVEETNVLSESITGRIVEQGYNVVDIASLEPGLAKEVETAVKRNDMLYMRSLTLKSLSNLALLGKVDFAHSTQKGEDVGYGAKMPFNVVTARLNYKLVSAIEKKILLAESLEAKGKALNEKDAANQAMKQLVEKMSVKLIATLGKYMEGATKKVTVKFVGTGTSLGETLGLKEMLQNLAWVKSVEEVRTGEFIVEYPENTIYLINSITQNPKYKLKDFTQYSVQLLVEK
ncbi:MAG: hypothetical protein OHK0040_10520 [bacterium]